MIERETLRKKVMAVPLALSLGLGMAACSEADILGTPGPQVICQAPGTLNDYDVKDSGNDGMVNAANTDTCATVYDPQTLQATDVILADEPFKIACYQEKPSAFQVETITGAVGTVNIDGNALRQLILEDTVSISPCALPDSSSTL